MPSLDSSHQQEIDALVTDVALKNPKDIIQHCADYFNSRLAFERQTHLSNSSKPAAMADTAGPFDRARNQNTIQEEDEEHDTFGSPTQQQNFRSNASPFSSSFGGFGGSTGSAGASGGGLFGNWGSSSDADTVSANQHTPANFPGAGRRTSVSAEAMQPDADSGNWKPPKHQKTQDQLDRLRTAVSANFLFTSLDDNSFNTVLDALSEKSIPAANIRVIDQGAEGDYFYVVESGEFDVYIHESGAPSGNDAGKKVASVGSGGSKSRLPFFFFCF